MSENAQREMTFGEKAVGLSFNPSGDTQVGDLKVKAAAFIDACHALRGQGANKEVARMASIAITEAQTAQMWAVKAATQRPFAPVVIEHEASAECWCEPELNYVDPVTGASVYVHKKE